MFIIVLCIVFQSASARQYNSYITDRAYHFHVTDNGARVSISDGRHLVVKTPRWGRKWALPSDANINQAQTFRTQGHLKVIVPRFMMPELVGGDVERGTVVNFTEKHICSTFDNSDPVCGSPCKHGTPLKKFTVVEDEVIVKLKNCKASDPVKTIIYHAYDNDIIIEDIGRQESPEIYGKHGWFDRHGNERAY